MLNQESDPQRETKKRILVVDDEPDLRELICDFLVDGNYFLESAADGIAALECYSKNKFDAVLTDFRMPMMDGGELIDQLKKLDPNLPILLITADVPTSRLLDLLKYKNLRIINKPMDRYLVKRTLIELLEK